MFNKAKILNPVLYSMAEGYRKQLLKYKAMLKLAEKQKKYTEEDDMDKLAEVIEARQFLINELDEMNKKLKPLRDEIITTLGLKDFSSTAILKVIPTTAAQELADVLSELGDVLYALKEWDKQNEQLLRKKLTIIKKELSGVQNKHQAVKAYKKTKDQFEKK